MGAGGQAILVTGGAGFIGSHLVERLVAAGHRVVVLDALTYAGHRVNLAQVSDRIAFRQGDICDSDLVARLLDEHAIGAVINCAAESHVDRSIAAPAAFIRTNVIGAERLLTVATEHWRALPDAARDGFRFVQVSTDEVFGSLGATGTFDERSPYRPNSPYAASKAAADHLAFAWHHTYGLPVVITHGSNTYGPRQYPEKLIPRLIRAALAGAPLPVYGDGLHVRDWLHVADHCAGIERALTRGQPGARYCLGGGEEWRNLDLVRRLCTLLDAVAPRDGGHAQGIRHVADRPGHDRRYALDSSRARTDLGFCPAQDFATGLAETVRWYCANDAWCDQVTALR
jgi:dTDP-glucose 4,6-dehydratase